MPNKTTYFVSNSDDSDENFSELDQHDSLLDAIDELKDHLENGVDVDYLTLYKCQELDFSVESIVKVDGVTIKNDDDGDC